MQADPARLRAIANAVRVGRPLDPEDVRFLFALFERRPGPGERLPATRLRMAERDAALGEAAARYFGDLSIPAQAAELAAMLARYASSGWLRDRTAERPPPRHAGRIEGLLWLVLKANLGRSIGARRMQQILEMNPGYSFRTEAPKIR